MFRNVVLLISALSLGNSQSVSVPLTPADRTQIFAALKKDEMATSPAPTATDEELTRDIIIYATQELGQRVRPSVIDKFWAIEPSRHDVEKEFVEARATGDLGTWLADLSPAQPDYASLKTAYKQYAALAAAGGWQALPPATPPKADQASVLSVPLRARLAKEGYAVAPPVDSAIFDDGLIGALQLFQTRHGLAADGKLGPATRAALDMPAAARLDQIEANLERLRWLPRPLPADRLEVDIAGAEAALFQAGRATLSMRVVVGKPSTQTPMFASQLEAVVFNPPWNVPGVIAKKEILPKAARSPGYWASEGFVMTPQGVQQKPGPKNALGQIKFDLPSPFGVYLHDTPAKSAFGLPARALSHGCMRLEKPRDLAQIALAWDAGKVDDATAAGVTSREAMPRPIPLFVVYRTVVVDSAGVVNFRPDVYGWDVKLTKALTARPTIIAQFGQAVGDCSVRGMP
jgi:murein L,D-transpeptidase YcbB/YkuD